MPRAVGILGCASEVLHIAETAFCVSSRLSSDQIPEASPIKTGMSHLSCFSSFQQARHVQQSNLSAARVSDQTNVSPSGSTSVWYNYMIPSVLLAKTEATCIRRLFSCSGGSDSMGHRNPTD